MIFRTIVLFLRHPWHSLAPRLEAKALLTENGYIMVAQPRQRSAAVCMCRHGVVLTTNLEWHPDLNLLFFSRQNYFLA